jgi:4-hydroxybenzoate polyprenyltransferase/phosphoserine phosphatase
MVSAAGAKTAKATPPVLCVDLDGTLIRGDLVWECVLALLKTRPLTLFLLPFWFLSGKVHAKRHLATSAHLDAARLPYRGEVLDLLEKERERGRKTVLVTGADHELAELVAAHLGLFDEVHASNGQVNLTGRNKAAFLAEHFAGPGFDYMGDSAADLAVWRKARGAYVVGSKRRIRQAAEVADVKVAILDRPASAITWINALRGHHWAKNLLLFLPLVLAHTLLPDLIVPTFMGFLLFGACASGLYILNDLLDLHSDREHPWKRLRPFAAGEISIPQGLLAALILLGGALGAGFALRREFGFALFGYATLTMWYSLQLKQIALLDVFVLSSFYSFRILAGAVLSKTPLSQWFLAFSLFFFLSLAMAKRYSELVHAAVLLKSGNSGRGYLADDRELLLSLGVGSSFAAAVILSLYIHSQDVRVLYVSPEFLFLLCPIVLYWMSRNWLLAHRGELREDPVTLALRDRVSYGVAFATALVIAASMIHMRF